MTRFVVIVFAITLCLSLVCLTIGQELFLKTEGKKGRGSIILLGRKCVPTLIKNGGKRGKDVIIIGDNQDCGPKVMIPKYIPIFQKAHYSYQPSYSYPKYKIPLYSGYGGYGHLSNYGHGGYGSMMGSGFGSGGYGGDSGYGYGYTPGASYGSYDSGHGNSYSGHGSY